MEKGLGKFVLVLQLDNYIEEYFTSYANSECDVVCKMYGAF